MGRIHEYFGLGIKVIAMWLAGSWFMTKGTNKPIPGNPIKPIVATIAIAFPVSTENEENIWNLLMLSLSKKMDEKIVKYVD